MRGLLSRTGAFIRRDFYIQTSYKFQLIFDLTAGFFVVLLLAGMRDETLAALLSMVAVYGLVGAYFGAQLVYMLRPRTGAAFKEAAQYRVLHPGRRK